MSEWRVRATVLALAAGLLSFGSPAAAERSYPLDCLPDRLVAWNPLGANPSSMFGAAYLPGIVLGPPGDSLPYQGSFSVASLGFNGSAVLGWDDIVIEDRPGPDFIVFENAFFKLPLPGSSSDPFSVFAEPGIVAVSADGLTWHVFPHNASALAQVPNQPDGTISAALYAQLAGLAGTTPDFTGNWTVPDDRFVFDPAGTGGISGAGGDAFDLATVGMTEARFVKIVDANTQAGFPGSAAGFDLGSVIVLHGRPRAPLTLDSDGDRVSDAEELMLYGSSPVAADSDGDGLDDGREIAGCRSPTSSSAVQLLHAEPRLWLLDNGGCVEVRWTFMGSGKLYDVVRGTLPALVESAGTVSLGAPLCLQNDDTDLRWSCDAALPDPGAGFFYLVRVDKAPNYGHSSQLNPRVASGGCP